MKTTLWRFAIIASLSAYAALRMYSSPEADEFFVRFAAEFFAYGLAVVIVYGLASLAFEGAWLWLTVGIAAALAVGFGVSGGEDSLETVLTVGSVSIAGIVLGAMVRRGVSPFRAYLVAAAIMTAAVLVSLIGNWSEMQTAMTGWRATLAKDFDASMNLSGYSADAQEGYRAAFKKAIDLVTRLMPASTLLSGIVQVSLGFLWFGLRLRRLYQREVIDPFVLWKVPFALLPVVIVLACMRLLGNDTMRLIADNGFMIAAIFYCLAGLALVEFTIRRLNIGWFMKGLFYVMLFLTQIFGFLLVSLLGFIDSFADWRKIGAAKLALKN